MHRLTLIGSLVKAVGELRIARSITMRIIRLHYRIHRTLVLVRILHVLH